MSDAATAPAPVAPATGKKTGKSGGSASKKPKAKPTHPKTADMVNAAIKNLKERGGSSLQAIKKYIATNYKVDAEKMAPFIRKYLKVAVTSGSLVQTKGKGASGSFKLATDKTTTTGSKKSKTAGEPKAKKAKTTTAAAKKPSPKKAGAPKKTGAGVKKATATPKAPRRKTGEIVPSFKAKKATKVPTKKPKAPKPKKVSQKTAKSPKKAAPKKK